MVVTINIQVSIISKLRCLYLSFFDSKITWNPLYYTMAVHCTSLIIPVSYYLSHVQLDFKTFKSWKL